jgi:Zn ribbon nucleic-acid-binding protein
MDLMFEEESDEVGSDVEAYCPKCKADTTHVVISKYEDEIRRVQCNPCGDVHSYRKPRGEVEDDVPEPIAAKKRAQIKKLNWEEFFAKHGNKVAKPYEFRELYKENVIVEHPKFGKGFVSEVVSDSKVEITFKDSRRILVHNRKDIPGLPLAAEGDGMPTPSKESGKDKGGDKLAKVNGKEPPQAKAMAAGKKPVSNGEKPAAAAKAVAPQKPVTPPPKAAAKPAPAPEKKKAADKAPDKKASAKPAPAAKAKAKPAAKASAKPAAKGKKK